MMGFRKLLLVFLLSIFLQVETTPDCDFVKCVKAVRSYIHDVGDAKKTPFVCKKLTDIPWCSEHCMNNYFPNAFSPKKNPANFIKYCEENISNRLNANWSCIAKHNYRILSCLATANTLTPNDVREDVMLTESCRKSLEFQSCPEQVLQADCGKDSANVVKDLIIFILDYYQSLSCKGINVKEVLSMPVYYHLGSDFVEAAKFLDAHQSTAHTCLSQFVQDEIDLDGYVCGEYEPHVNECIHALLKKENSQPNVDRLLKQIIYLSGFKCKQSSLELSTISILLTDASKGVKQEDNASSEVKTVIELIETSTLKNIENGDVLHKKTQVPLKDTAYKKYVDKNLTIIKLSDSVSKNSKRDMNQSVKSSNVCSRLDFSVLMLIFFFTFLLFIFR